MSPLLLRQFEDAGFLVLDAASEAIVPTEAAARIINRKPQTLRKWACYESGPIRPIRIHGRLGWRISDLQKLLSEGE